jgi:hypothetical protein
MSRLIGDVHVFSYFAEYDYGDISPSKTIVGKINSMDDYNRLIPSPRTRVEIDRAPGSEEIRVIKNENGDYHVTADHHIARELLKQIDQETIEIFQPEINPFPESLSNLKNENYYRDIIQFDPDGDRILPGIRRVGFLSTIEEWRAMDTGEMAGYEAESFVGLENTKTGDVWWATDELKKEILQRRRQLEEEDEDGTEDPTEENESGEVKA